MSTLFIHYSLSITSCFTLPYLLARKTTIACPIDSSNNLFFFSLEEVGTVVGCFEDCK